MSMDTIETTRRRLVEILRKRPPIPEPDTQRRLDWNLGDADVDSQDERNELDDGGR